MISLVLALVLGGSPSCEKPKERLRAPYLAPMECTRYSKETQECAATCYWPGRPDGGAWDDNVKAFAQTKEACYALLKDLCAAKKGAPR